MAKKKKSSPATGRHLLYALILVIITAGVYGSVTQHDFLNYDDDTLITGNRVVVDPARSWTDCFTWNLFSPHYKPLVLLSWRAEYQTFGDDPGVFHFNNLLFHLLNVLLVFLVSIPLLKVLRPTKQPDVWLMAFFIALLYSVHPLHVESVAWAVERKDVMYSFFFLLSWLSYLYYLDKQKYIYLILSAVFYLLVLLSKSMGITLIAVLFLTDYAYGRRNIAALIREKIPLLACFLAGIYLYGLLDYMGAFLSGSPTAGNVSLADTPGSTTSTFNPVIEVGVMSFLKIFLLLMHTILPIHVSAIYEGPEIQRMLGAFIYVIPFLLAGLVYLAWRMSVRHKAVFFGLLFFLVTVSPAIAIGRYGGVGVFIGDRYTYMAMLGIILPFVLWVFQFKTKPGQLPMIVVGALALVLSFASFKQVSVWKNPLTLWNDVISKTKCGAAGHNGRGVYYLTKDIQYEKAIDDFTRAIACDSLYARSFYNRGLAYMNLKKNTEAFLDYNRAIQLNPRYVEAYVNRGSILTGQGKNDEALVDFNYAIQLNPDFAKSYFNRGNLFINTQRFEEARQDYTKAISLDVNYAKAYYNRAIALQYLGDKAASCGDFQAAFDLGYGLAAESLKNYCQ